MSNQSGNDLQRILLELKSVQLELFTITYRNLYASLTSQQDQVRFMDPKLKDPRVVSNAYGQVYSQNNEDGIISEIFRRIGVKNRTFVEFGVGNGLENNTRLLLEQGWSGRWVEGDAKFAEDIRNQFNEVIQKGQLELIEAMISRLNASRLANVEQHNNELDFLSIDVDFLTSHIWRELSHIKPRLVCIEYNAHYPASVAYEVPYDTDRAWIGDTQFGASLKQLELIGADLGYALVGCDLLGVNAFFVRSDLADPELFLEPFTSENHYQPPRFSLVHHRGHSPALPVSKNDNEGASLD